MSNATPPPADTTPIAAPPPWVNIPTYTSLDGGPDLHLVLVRDVVRWLMQSKPMRFVPAVLAVHLALSERQNELLLYVTDENGVARAVGDADTFNLLPVVGRRTISRGIGHMPAPASIPVQLPDGVEPGLSAALHFIKTRWGDGRNPESILDREDLAASRLSMLCDQAVALWGEKPTQASSRTLEVSDSFEDLCQQRAVAINGSWSDAQRTELANESARLSKDGGRNGVRQFLATKLGLKNPEAVSKQIRLAPKSKPSATVLMAVAK